MQLMKVKIIMLLVPCMLGAMEKNNVPFELEQLPVDMQRLIIVPSQTKIHEIVQSSATITQAFVEFNSYLNQVVRVIRTISKSLSQRLGFDDLKKIMFTFLDEVANKFPGQEVRAIYALGVKDKAPLLEWLNKRRLQQNRAPFTRVRPNNEQIEQAMTYLNENNSFALKQWLEAGYDPNQLLLPAINSGDLAALKLLVAYGADLQTSVRIGQRNKSLIAYVKDLMQAADDQEDPELEDDYRKILRYLKDEGARE